MSELPNRSLPKKIKMIDLFTGIGAWSYAGHLLNIETIGFCEFEPECRRVLSKHWPEIKVINDIKDMKGDEFGYADIITGGYPCQPFSVAGNQKASEDDRHLWPEMYRVIKKVRPSWVICENVVGHIELGLDEVHHDLESIGYSSTTFDIPALATGANHNRRRVFIVAYTSSNGLDESTSTGSNEASNEYITKGTDKDSNNEGLSSLRSTMERGVCTDWRRGTKPAPLRMDDELPRQLDKNRGTRNKMLGNSIDPKICYEILKSIIHCKSELEKGA